MDSDNPAIHFCPECPARLVSDNRQPVIKIIASGARSTRGEIIPETFLRRVRYTWRNAAHDISRRIVRNFRLMFRNKISDLHCVWFTFYHSCVPLLWNYFNVISTKMVRMVRKVFVNHCGITQFYWGLYKKTQLCAM